MDNEISKEIHQAAHKHCEPLYLTSPYMIGDAHTNEKANGTITYIKYKNGIYGVTCAHVYYEQFEQEKWLAIHGKERYVFHFGQLSQDGYKSHFVPLSKKFGTPDIAITRLDRSVQEIHFPRKNKSPIDLDNWTEPNWTDLKVPVGFGFPTEHKTNSEEFLQAPLLAVAAELTRPILPTDETFLMSSSLEHENNFFFSGMSGGPVFCVSGSEEPLTLIGVTFEGTPGSSTEWAKRDEQSFFSKREIQLKVQLLTPEIFAEWIRWAGI